MAIFRLITFFIHAVVAAIASMLAAVFTRLVPAFVAVAVVVGVAVAVCTSCGMGSLALRRRRKQGED